MKAWLMYAVGVALIAAGIGTSRAEVFTYAKRYAHGIGSFKEFSTKETPCFVKAPGLNPDDIPQLRKLFAEAGMNAVADKDAPCKIMVEGYVTMPNGEGKPITPVNAEFILQNQDKIIDVGPALSATDTGAGKAASDASGIDRSISAADIETSMRAGNLFAGSQGSIIATVVASLADVVSGISARNKTKDGVAMIRVSNSFGRGLFPAALGLEIYAASTTKENPSVLIRAAVNRFVHELQLKEQEDKKKDMGETTAASAFGTEGMGSVQ
jgi:hypothetical protein